jgi:proteasome lid subunit RPN8/RPN11
LRISLDVVKAVLAHAEEASPSECCGLLIGTADAIARAWPARNVASSPSAYLVDPVDHFAAIRAAREAGMDVMGAYHSHPVSAPLPSQRDLAEALPRFLYLIVSPGSAIPVRAFSLDSGVFEEVRLIPEGQAGQAGAGSSAQ